MRRSVIGLAALALCLAADAHATVGGPTLCKALGWSPAEHRAYFLSQPGSAGDMFGDVVYLDLSSSEPGVLHRLPWTTRGEGTARDSSLWRRLRALQARLRPLEPEPVQALPLRWEVTSRDTLVGRQNGWSVPRAHVRASFDGDLSFDVATFGSEHVCRTAYLRVPGRAEHVEIICFAGDPDEGGYEVQVPVLVRPRESGARPIVWEAWK